VQTEILFCGRQGKKPLAAPHSRRLCVAWAFMRRERGLRKDALSLTYFISPFVKRPHLQQNSILLPSAAVLELTPDKGVLTRGTVLSLHAPAGAGASVSKVRCHWHSDRPLRHRCRSFSAQRASLSCWFRHQHTNL
jgi:hypothetical protein